MAGHGPAPKLPGERRNRHPPQRGEWVDLPPLDAPVLPELPALEGDEGWRAQTRVTWEAWRVDPVTAMWSPADVAHALDTILLHNGMTASNANEVRLRMDGLGLTPKGKKDLRWKYGDPSEDAAVGRARDGSRSLNRDKRKQRLSVVK